MIRKTTLFRLLKIELLKKLKIEKSNTMDFLSKDLILTMNVSL